MTHEENHRQYLNLLIAQDKTFGSIYGQMANELSSVLKRYKVRANSNVWHKNLQIKKEVDAILTKYRTIIFSQISTASSNAWELSERHNDGLVDQYTNGINVPKKQKQRYYDRNVQALVAFQQRSRDGFKLSDRVWKLTVQTRDQLETFIAEGLTEGRSAVSLAGDLKKYLQDPDKRFRRVRNKVTGKLMTSAPGENYHPGRGVYRSSYKNALRLARNEINIAYRTADIERRKNLPFVTGIKINLSPAHPAYDICDELQGEYPKEFVFTGWHVNCLCFTTSKLLSRKEFIDHLNGKGIPQSKYVKSIPENAARYLNANSDRIKGLANKPYFIRDNFKNTKDGLDLKKSIGTFPKLEPLNELEAIKQLKDAGITVNYNKENYKLFKERSPGFDFNIMFQELEGHLMASGINNVRKSGDLSLNNL